jgi:CheY-like chemotaxis protein
MRSILVVDDNAMARKNISTFLSGEGYEIDQANDGIEALEKLNHRNFDLVLSDIVMPRMNGLALIDQVCSSWPQTRIIAMTAYFQADSEKTFLVAGADDFIRKPIVLKDLLAKIQRVLGAQNSTA